MIGRIVRKIIYREKADSKTYISYLRNKGVQIGEGVVVYSPTHTHIDVTCPWLISIGNHVRITHGVIILTHDYAWSVVKKSEDNAGMILGAQSPVSIGDNVFIGMNAIITRGATIGNNVIIGAGSVVTGNCESNSVYAGVPAKKIMSLEEFKVKREQKQFEEAREIAQLYFKRFGKRPPKEVFREYFQLFCDADTASRVPEFCGQMRTGDGYSECYNYMSKVSPPFKDYEHFLAECFSTKA